MESRSNGSMESIETTLVQFPYVERGCLQTRTVVASYSSICCPIWHDIEVALVCFLMWLHMTGLYRRGDSPGHSPGGDGGVKRVDESLFLVASSSP